MRYARLPSGGSEGLALKQKHRKQATHHHTDNDKGTGETVVSQQIKIMAEYALLTMIKTEQHGLDSAVGINTGYHGQQSRKETGFRRALERGVTHTANMPTTKAAKVPAGMMWTPTAGNIST